MGEKKVGWGGSGILSRSPPPRLDSSPAPRALCLLHPTPHPQGRGSSSLPVFPEWRVSLKAGHGQTGSVPTQPNFLYGCSEKEGGKNPSCSRLWTLVAGSWLSLKTMAAPWGAGGGGTSTLLDGLYKPGSQKSAGRLTLVVQCL